MSQTPIAAVELPGRDRLTRFFLAWVIGLAAAGEICRLAQYLSFQSFWEDEIGLLLNVRAHPARELPFVRLVAWSEGSPQAAPPFFLWTTQWMGNRTGYAEWAVRLLPLLCSLGAVPLVAHLAWRVTTPPAAAWATGLFALSDPLLFQAGNAKPYSGDVFVAALIAWMALALGGSPARRLVRAAVVTAAAVWLSYTAVFTFAAVALALWGELDKSRLRGAARMAVLSLPAVGSFLVVYFLCIRAQRDVNLDVYWVHMFPNFSRPPRIPFWVIGATWELFHFQMDPIGPIMIAGAAAGVWSLWRRGNRRLLIVLTGPLTLNLLASCLAQYPYGGTRLTLFLAPSLCMLSGVGAAAAPILLPKWRPWARLALATVPVSMAGLAAIQLIYPRNKGNMRDAVRFLSAHRQADEEVYLVGNQTQGAADWYIPHPDGLTHRRLEQSAPIRASRFWLVICYEPRKFGENKIAFTQPNARIDESRSLHIHGADVLYFVPKN